MYPGRTAGIQTAREKEGSVIYGHDSRDLPFKIKYLQLVSRPSVIPVSPYICEPLHLRQALVLSCSFSNAASLLNYARKISSHVSCFYMAPLTLGTRTENRPTSTHFHVIKNLCLTKNEKYGISHLQLYARL